MTDSRREIKDVLYLVALQGVNYVMPLVVFPYLMMVLGAEKFGYIGFSTALVQFFNNLSAAAYSLYLLRCLYQLARRDKASALLIIQNLTVHVRKLRAFRHYPISSISVHTANVGTSNDRNKYPYLIFLRIYAIF